MECKQCGKELAPDDVFCGSCGCRVESEDLGTAGDGEKRFCVNCGRILKADAKFCPNCGRPVDGESEGELETACGYDWGNASGGGVPKKKGKPPKNTKGKKLGLFKKSKDEGTAAEELPEGEGQENEDIKEILPIQESSAFLGIKTFLCKKKKAVIGAAAAAVLAVGGIAGWMLLGGSSAPGGDGRVLYTKSGEVWGIDASEKEPEKEYYDLEMSSISYDVGGISGYLVKNRVRYSEDYSYIYYPENKSDTVDYSFELYRRSLKSGDVEYIADEVTVYELLPDGRIIYTGGEDKALYLKDGEEKEKLAAGVYDFKVNKSGTMVTWIQDVHNTEGAIEGDLYVRALSEKGAEKEKIASEATLAGYSDDMKNFIYLRDKVLYLQREGQERVKVDSDVQSAQPGDENLETFYYMKDSPDGSLDWTAFLEDDMQAADEVMNYPAQEDYQIQKTEKASGSNKKVYVPDEEAYQKAVEAYEEKTSRDKLREQLKGLDMSIETRQLCFYGNGEAGVVEEYFNSSLDYPGWDKGIIYESIKPPAEKKLKLSEFQDFAEAEEAIRNSVFENTTVCAAAGREVTAIAPGFGLYQSSFEEKTGTAAVLLYNEENTVPKLVKINVQEDGTFNIAEVDQNVAYLSCIMEGSMYYIKEENNSKGDLYCDGKKIDTDVYEYSPRPLSDGLSIVYACDYNEEKQRGVMKTYDGTEVKTIAEDVHMYQELPGTGIAVLSDYSSKSQKGELKLYFGDGEMGLLDEDVDSILLGVLF